MACLLTVMTKIQPTNQPKNHKANTPQNMTRNRKLQYRKLLNLKYVAIAINPQKIAYVYYKVLFNIPHNKSM